MSLEAGPWTAKTALSAVTSLPPIAPRTLDVLEAFGMTSKRCSLTHQTMRSSSTEPCSSSRWVYWALPGATLPRLLVRARCRTSCAPAPTTRTVPRWLTSKMAADWRQARCSATVPVPNSSGISQPPNATNRAPWSRCHPSRGLWRRLAEASASSLDLRLVVDGRTG